MPENTETGQAEPRAGDRRQGDRRKADRRREDRRALPPWWRRPWALVGYGVVGTLLVVLLLNGRGDQPQQLAVADEIRTTPATPAAQARDPAVAAAPAQAAYRAADFERLLAEGETAVGQRVLVELFCSSITQVSLRSVERVESSVAALADINNRVPAAECKWGQRQHDVSREDFLLLVPPELAEAFASAPVVQDGFVSRRHVRAEIEWLGRSDALHLRTGGVLQRLIS